ncbi:MAG TPA: MGMT family protein, partial [Planctomycetota bacterium]
PCHRVVNKSGELGGYGGGLWRKKLLLHLEQTGEPLAWGDAPGGLLPASGRKREAGGRERI